MKVLRKAVRNLDETGNVRNKDTLETAGWEIIRNDLFPTRKRWSKTTLLSFGLDCQISAIEVWVVWTLECFTCRCKEISAIKICLFLCTYIWKTARPLQISIAEIRQNYFEAWQGTRSDSFRIYGLIWRARCIKKSRDYYRADSGHLNSDLQSLSSSVLSFPMVSVFLFSLD